MSRPSFPDIEESTNMFKLPKQGSDKLIPAMDPISGDSMNDMAKQLAEQSAKMQKDVMEYYKKITSSNKLLLRFILVVGIIIIILIIIFYISNRNNRNGNNINKMIGNITVSYTHLRAHETG